MLYTKIWQKEIGREFDNYVCISEQFPIKMNARQTEKALNITTIPVVKCSLIILFFSIPSLDNTKDARSQKDKSVPKRQFCVL